MPPTSDLDNSHSLTPHENGSSVSFLVFRQVLTGDTLAFLAEYVNGQVRAGCFRNEDYLVPSAPAVYGDPVMERLLATLQPRWEEALLAELYPTYSYFRRYGAGDVLPRHTDRAACEITVSLCLGMEPKDPWLIYLEESGVVHSVSLLPGDGLLFHGRDLPHWRDPFRGTRCDQVFLHYVRSKGHSAVWRFDKRPSLFSPPNSQ
jgi:hypothetical protein